MFVYFANNHKACCMQVYFKLNFRRKWFLWCFVKVLTLIVFQDYYQFRMKFGLAYMQATELQHFSKRFRRILFVVQWRTSQLHVRLIFRLSFHLWMQQIGKMSSFGRLIAIIFCWILGYWMIRKRKHCC